MSLLFFSIDQGPEPSICKVRCWEAQMGGVICALRADSCCCTEEASMMLKNNYTLIKKIKKEKRKVRC